MIAALLLMPDAAAFNHIQICNGNPTHWETQPSVWRLTAPGGGAVYSQLGDAEVTNAFAVGFDVWSDANSCCSGWLHANGGTTGTGYNPNDNVNTISFAEQNWDPAFGSVNSTIAVTVPVFFQNDCEIFNADEVYNAVGFDFTTVNNPGFNDTDLQSIAAHEHGHWLGLDHSGVGQATMFASYSGGIGPRSLHNDDEAGVCDSHPGNCGPQETDCSDGVDDEGDGLVDCADPDCASFPDCTCPVDGTVGCDNTITGTTVGGTNTVQSWGCAQWETTGPEAVYTFVPSEDGPVTVTASNLQDDLDLFVTTESSGGCEPGNCAASGNQGVGNEVVVFDGFAGVAYAVVLDGWDGASSSFTLTTDCPDPQGGGDCDPFEELACNSSRQGSNFGFENNVQEYSCVEWQTTGPEVVYSLTPSVSGSVTIDLTGLSADLDLFVTTEANGQCNNNNCIGSSGNPNSSSESVTFQATAGTTYMVVADGWDGASSNYDISATCEGGGDPDVDADADADADADIDADVDVDVTDDTDDRSNIDGCGCNGTGTAGLLALPLALLAVRRRR